jgi:uncharacterized protein (TIGR02246 family)
MRLLLGLSFLLSATVLPPAGGLSAQRDDEVAVKDVVRKYLEGREHGDAQTIEALFTGDADQLVSTGEWRKGRGEVVRGTIESSRRARGARTITVESVRFVAPGVAVADGRYEIAGQAGGESRKMWTTMIMTRDSGAWRITAIRNMVPAPATGAR